MKWKKAFVCTTMAVLALGLAACGGSSGGGGGGGNTGNLTDATTMTTLGVTPTASGGSIRFTAADSSGNAILAHLSPGASERLKLAVWNILLRECQAQVGGCTCTATTDDPLNPAPTCSITDITSTQGTGASGGTVATGIVIDNTGSMLDNDPSALRRTAAQGAIDALAAGTVADAVTSNNMVFVSDFATGISPTAPFTDIREDFAWAVLNSTTNVTNAKNSVVAEDNGSTNLWDAVIDVCTDMKSASVAVVTTSGSRNGHFAAATAPANSNSTIADNATTKTMLILTDGDDNSSTNTVNDVVTCLQAGSGNDDIVAYVVGLGDSINTTDLTTVANANNGIYTTVSDAAALTPTFQAMVGAATNGYNTATFRLTDATTETAITVITGTNVTINLTCGTATGTATYVQP